MHLRRIAASLLLIAAVDGVLTAQNAGYPKLLQEGLSQIESGHFRDAEALLQSAQRAARSNKDTYTEALAETGLGQLYETAHRFNEAEQMYKLAIPVFRQSQERQRVLVMSLRSLGSAYSGEQRYVEALQTLTEASDLAKTLVPNESQLTMQVLTALGVLHLRQNNPGKAEKFFTEAYNLQPASQPIALDVANILNNLGLIYANKHQYEKAAASYNRARQILEQRLGPRHLQLATVLENLGFLHSEMKRYEEAETEFQSSLDIIKDSEQQLEDVRIQALNGINKIYMTQNKKSEAKTLLTEAVEIGRKTPLARPFLPSVLDTYSTLLSEDARDVAVEAKHVRAELTLTVRVPKN